MWVFCKHGFFSAVENQNDKNTILLRARFVGDLERLSDAFGLGLSVKRTPDADYLFRAVLPKEKWAEVVMETAREIDYPNFKGSLPHDKANAARNAAYMDCWSALRRRQLGR